MYLRCTFTHSWIPSPAMSIFAARRSTADFLTYRVICFCQHFRSDMRISLNLIPLNGCEFPLFSHAQKGSCAMTSLNPNCHLRCWRFRHRASSVRVNPFLRTGHLTLLAKKTGNLLTRLRGFYIFPTARGPRFPSTFLERHVHFPAT